MAEFHPVLYSKDITPSSAKRIDALVGHFKASVARARLPDNALQVQDFPTVLSLDFIIAHVVIRFNNSTRSIALQTYLNCKEPICAAQCVGVLNDTFNLTINHVDTIDGTVCVRNADGHVHIAYNLTIFRHARIVGETYLFKLEM